MNKVQNHKNICEELNKIYEAKNKDYGDSFGKSFSEYGPIMAAIRLEDKLNRFKNLIKSEAKVKDERVEDTLLDLANYAIMTVMELKQKEEIKKVEPLEPIKEKTIKEMFIDKEILIRNVATGEQYQVKDKSTLIKRPLVAHEKLCSLEFFIANVFTRNDEIRCKEIWQIDNIRG